MRGSGGAGEWVWPRHFDGERFYNPDGRQAPGFRDLIRWQRSSRREKSPTFVDDVQPTVPPRRVHGEALRITVVNHSTVLIQGRGRNLLTDPIWSDRASPFPWIGPRRHRIPGVAWEDLPEIDVVLISHNHYDHLDLPTLKRLRERGETALVSPKGLGRLLHAQEMDWGDRVAFASCTVHCVPAHHFSGRGLFDRNRTLWCGYVIEFGGQKVYFAGDTGFADHFESIRERFGATDVALLPIGAYEPRWFMSPVHMTPDEALRAHEILGARRSVAIHHGTFQLADEGVDTPQKELRARRPDPSFLVLANGEYTDIA